MKNIIKTTTINIRVIPRSSRTEIKQDDQGGIRLYTPIPPIDGKANKECITVLSKKLRIPKSAISIVKGEKSRNKTIAISGISQQDIFNRLFILEENIT